METHVAHSSAAGPELVYQLKESPYSSHSVLMGLFPEEGRGSAVLDVGCGNGYLGAMLAARGYRVIGIERAGGYGSNFPAAVDLIEADLEGGLPELDREFDYILCADILEHLRQPGRLLSQLRGVMKPGARLIASLPNSGNLYFRLTVLLGRFPEHDKGLFDRTHLHFYVLDGWKRLLSESRFRVHRLGVTGIPVGLAIQNHAGSGVVRALERISYDLARLWKTLFAYQFVVTATAGYDGTTDRL